MAHTDTQTSAISVYFVHMAQKERKDGSIGVKIQICLQKEGFRKGCLSSGCKYASNDVLYSTVRRILHTPDPTFSISTN
jgi:hypothetical protein